VKATGNTILITGGTSGIGLGLALKFHQAGNVVIIAGRRKDLLDSIVAEHPGIKSVLLDVTDPASIADAFEHVNSTYPKLNVLINNAGIMLPENVLAPQHLAVAEDTVATNLLGPIRMTYAFLPLLAAQDDAVIMNVTSGLAFVPMPLTATYNATKAAIHSFTESLRVQLQDTSVEVLELIPPGVRTALMNQENNEQYMPLEDFLIEATTIITTQPNVVQICVENVKPLRFAEANGKYDYILELLSKPALT
jgi:uncharacterized oxidoreductase